MRVPTGNIPFQPLTHLWERHNEIARRLVSGDRPIDIAHSMGMTTSRLSIIMNSPAFKMRVAELSALANKSAADVQTRINELAVDSMAILESVIRDRKAEGISPALKIKVAQDVLDRAGYSAVQKTASLSLTGDDIDELRRRRDASRAPAQMRTVNAQQA